MIIMCFYSVPDCLVFKLDVGRLLEERFFFQLLLFLNVFRTSLLGIVLLQFKMNHKRTRVSSFNDPSQELKTLELIFCLSIVLNIQILYIKKMVL